MAENTNGNGASNGANGNGAPYTAGTLTTRQGHPVPDNQNLRTVGNRGPAVLENYHFLEKITHFDRERIQSVSCTPAVQHGLEHATALAGVK